MLTPSRHDSRPRTILGRTSPFDAGGFVDLLVDQRAMPRFVAGRLWTRLVGEARPDAATLDALARAFGADHDVTALVRAIANAPGFRAPDSVLVRQPVEWLVAALRALRVSPAKLRAGTLFGALAGMGQTPFQPPSVGGWPSGRRWLTTAAALARLTLAKAVVAAADLSPVADEPPRARVDAVAHVLGIPRFSASTAAALAPLAYNPPTLVAAALASPETAVSG